MTSAAPLRFVTGDATDPQAEGPRVIAHICNDVGGWGKGFVLAISKKWPEPERDYRDWHRHRAGNDFGLGAVRLIEVQAGLWVANMIAQHGMSAGRDGPPIRYPAVARCLLTLGDRAIELGASVHMPRIGCGLAGGGWDQIEPLIDAALCQRGVPVAVYDLAS
jgi:O-acetyl-ADP-ribose deacetylase (regulator of RNase III)